MQVMEGDSLPPPPKCSHEPLSRLLSNPTTLPPYSSAQLARMDRRFVERLRRAFRAARRAWPRRPEKSPASGLYRHEP
jgi:hypothetical protein